MRSFISLSAVSSVSLAASLGVLSLAGCSKSPDPKLVYVSSEASGEVAVVDPDSAQVVTRVAVGKRPRGLKVSRDGKLLFVALSGSPRGGPNVAESKLPPADRSADGIGVVDLVTQKLVRTLSSGQDPESFDLSLDGKTLFVSNEETAELSVLDVAAGKVTRRVPVGKEPEGVTLRPDGKVVYVTSEEDSQVSAIDTTTFAVVGTIKTGLRPRGIVVTKDGAIGFISNELSGTLTVFDAAKEEAIGTITIDAQKPIMQRPMGLALAEDGTKLFVSTGRGGAIAVVDVAKRELDHLIDGVGARPWGIALERGGRRLFAANGSSDDLSIVDVGLGKVTQHVKIGGLPWGATTGAHPN